MTICAGYAALYRRRNPLLQLAFPRPAQLVVGSPGSLAVAQLSVSMGEVRYTNHNAGWRAARAERVGCGGWNIIPVNTTRVY